MKLVKHITRSLFLVLFMSSLTAVSAQEQTKVDKQTDALVRAYQSDVAMTVEQAMEFYDKVKSYLVKRQEIKASSQAADAKKTALHAIDKQETTEMASILDGHQMKVYKKMKKTLQPM